MPGFFKDIRDPRRAQGRKHAVNVVLTIAAGAVYAACAVTKLFLIGRKHYRPKPLNVSVATTVTRKKVSPAKVTIRNVLIRIAPIEFDQALQLWNAQFVTIDESLAY